MPLCLTISAGQPVSVARSWPGLVRKKGPTGYRCLANSQDRETLPPIGRLKLVAEFGVNRGAARHRRPAKAAEARNAPCRVDHKSGSIIARCDDVLAVVSFASEWFIGVQVPQPPQAQPVEVLGSCPPGKHAEVCACPARSHRAHTSRPNAGFSASAACCRGRPGGKSLSRSTPATSVNRNTFPGFSPMGSMRPSHRPAK